MQNWVGKYKGAQLQTVDGQTVYPTFRAGHGDDEHAWVHPDLANTINFEYDPDNTGYDVLGPNNMYGSVLVGAKYWAPGNSGTDVGATGQFTDEGPLAANAYLK